MILHGKEATALKLQKGKDQLNRKPLKHQLLARPQKVADPRKESSKPRRGTAIWKTKALNKARQQGLPNDWDLVFDVSAMHYPWWCSRKFLSLFLILPSLSCCWSGKAKQDKVDRSEWQGCRLHSQGFGDCQEIR